MSAHTPGPWWVAESGVRDKGGYIALSLTTTHWPDQDERYAREVLERKANARLIAAAPKLLDALQLVRDYVATMKGMGHDYQVAIDAAIAEATGAKP